MDLINDILSIVAPPFTFFSLCLLLPPFQFLKFSLSFLNSVFTEDVAGKVIIITGASSGIGEQLAYEYARRGACLALVARRRSSLQEVANMCLEFGSPDSVPITADVSNVDDCKRIIDSTITRFGRLDHLVSNAGITSISMLEDYEDITIPRSVMDINFWGSAYITHLAIPHLKKTGGKIIAMSSTAAWAPTPRMSIYNASKAAMVALYETLRVELGSDIHVTLVTPGFVESEMTKGKHLAREGLMNVDPDLRDAQLGLCPIETGERCAKAIVNSACRGERYVMEPAWFRVICWLKALWPEVLDWFFWAFDLPSNYDDSPTESLNKKLLDLPGLRAIFYPSSINSPGVKTK